MKSKMRLIATIALLVCFAPATATMVDVGNVDEMDSDQQTTMELESIHDGFAPSDRIANGFKVESESYEWFARLVTKDGGRRRRAGTGRICGGALIGVEWVVTAAHCVIDRKTGGKFPDLYGWDIGYVCNTNGNCGQKRRLVKGSKWLVSDKYNPKKHYQRDLALVKLGTRVKFATYAVPDNGRMWRTLFYGERLRAIGMGHTENGSLAKNARLQAVDMPLLTNSQCEDDWNAPRGFYSQTLFCLENKNSKTTCAGDSGGPVVPRDWVWTSDGTRREVVTGIVSSGQKAAKCRQKTRPDLYTRVSSFYPLIHSVVCSHYKKKKDKRFRPSWCKSANSRGQLRGNDGPRVRQNKEYHRRLQFIWEIVEP